MLEPSEHFLDIILSNADELIWEEWFYQSIAVLSFLATWVTFSKFYIADLLICR